MRTPSDDSAVPRPARWLGALGLLLLAALAFGPSIQNGFALDDFPYLVENPAVKSFPGTLELLRDARTHTAGPAPQTYRPLRTALFALEHALFAERAAGYHVLNVVLHAGVALALWQLLRNLLTARAAWLAAALFACHPLQSEVVASIKAQDDLLAALAVVLGLLALQRAREHGAVRSLRAGAVAAFAFALLAKESALAFPVLLALWERTEAPARRTPLRWYAILAAVAAAWLALRHHALSKTELPAALPREWLFPSSVAAIPHYVKQFVWPPPLSIDHPWANAGELRGKLLFASLALQSAAAFVVARFGSRSEKFGLTWFYAAVLVSLNPVGSIVVYAERFAYLPLAGIAVIAVGRTSAALSARASWGLAAPLLCACVWVSAQRCADWRDNESLFRATLASHPSSEMARLALRREFVAAGRAGEAGALLGETSVRAPQSFLERGELADRALLALQRGDDAAAARLYEHITASPFAQWDDHLNFGVALTNLGQRGRARTELEQVLRERSTSAPAQRMLARLALESEQWSEALAHVRAALAIEPDHALTNYFLLLTTWRAEGDDAALAVLERLRAAKLDVGAMLRQDEANWSAASGKLRDAIEHAKRAAR